MKKKILLFIMIFGILLFSSIITEFILILEDNLKNYSILTSLFRSLSYFIIITNLFIVCIFYCHTKKHSKNKFILFFKNKNFISTITTAIICSCLFYLIILLFSTNKITYNLLFFNGLILRILSPIITFIFWWITIGRNKINWYDIPKWLIYPFLYLIYILLSGYILNIYPYSFIDINQIGTLKIFFNITNLFILFIMLSSVLMLFNHQLKK